VLLTQHWIRLDHRLCRKLLFSEQGAVLYPQLKANLPVDLVVSTFSKVFEQLLHFRGVVLVQLAFEKMLFFSRHAPKKGYDNAFVFFVQLQWNFTVSNHGAGEKTAFVLVFE
jgi:hypothetical protein